MPRGGRSSGGGGGRRFSSSSAKTAKDPPPASAAKGGGAPAPATTGGGGGSVLSNVTSAFAEGWIWSTTWAMANRAVDAVLGPRTFRIEHAAATSASGLASGADDDASSSSPSNPCQIHAMAFQDCINQNGSDISQCQFYVNILNDCRRRGQVAAVETSW